MRGCSGRDRAIKLSRGLARRPLSQQGQKQEPQMPAHGYFTGSPFKNKLEPLIRHRVVLQRSQSHKTVSTPAAATWRQRRGE
ncbi:hypothetical protein DIPPA_26763 [Diplonema papillatum]|nr:hypothetical protein DIPPA_26763 [Diplonema papillatum]